MSDSHSSNDIVEKPSTHATEANDRQPPMTAESAVSRREARRWWLKLAIQPLLFLAAGVLLIVGLGLAQRWGYIAAGGGGGASTSSADSHAMYICPMMCTPPQVGPGRCPVCGMELVPAQSGGGKTELQAVHLDPAARRVAHIRTATVASQPVTRTIRTIGEINYNEASLSTLAAYVDSRIVQLYADYTGVVVHQGDRLAQIYSPRLYSSQVEFLLAKKAYEKGRTSTLARLSTTHRELYDAARQRLIELGMTKTQITQLQQEGEAKSRLDLFAPISGTVIEKRAAEGQYVKEGEPIYRLADLSTVWLILKLFPEEAAVIRYGQQVQAEVQSLPGKTFTGRVAFIDPQVDARTRTVGVRVLIQNEDGLLRVGDYAKAKIDVQLGEFLADQRGGVYDPELAGKYISPRHPHLISPTPGVCPLSGLPLVPTSQYGFLETPQQSETLTVPRDAVLMAGSNSVVYVETEPGRFEIRRVVLGPSMENQMVILEGVKAGEQVATRGNFLIDSQMQLAGNPSLIDPARIETNTGPKMTEEMLAALAKLSEGDRRLAKSQQICPVTKLPLGSMGAPPKVDINGDPIFICCEACRDRLLADPQKHLVNLPEKSADSAEEKKIEAALDLLQPEDQMLAKSQRICPVADFRLGAMGAPLKVNVNGSPVFICCEGCRQSLLLDPAKYLAKLKAADKPEDSDQSNIPAVPGSTKVPREPDLPPSEDESLPTEAGESL